MSNRRVVAIAATVAAIAAPMEGMRQYAYYDPPGVLTVCEGHTGSDIQLHRKYSLAECQKYMAADMIAKVTAVDKCHPNLPDSVLIAMSDLAYNVGDGIVCDRSHTVAQYLYKYKYLEGCNAIPLYNKARVAGVYVALPGLTKRRALEREICLRDLYVTQS